MLAFSQSDVKRLRARQAESARQGDELFQSLQGQSFR